MRKLTNVLVLLTMPAVLCAQVAGSIQIEMTRLDALAANPELKLVVVAAIADSLEIHRNHLLLQRKETGQSFASIFVSELRAKGMDDGGILRSLRQVRLDVDRQVKQNAVAVSSGARPVLLLGSNVDHSSLATIYSVVPEIGFDSKHVAAVVGVPFYRVSNSSLSSGGIGDVYASAFLRGRTRGFDVGLMLTMGAPSGDREKGLGAGKVTADASATISRRFEFAKPWVSAGFANSVYNNVGYQRPYVTDGNAAHFAGGVDFALPHKLGLGVGGFGLEPVGNQTVYSQPAAASSSGQSNTQSGNGMMPGAGMGAGMGSNAGTGNSSGLPNTSMPFYGHGQQSAVPPSELRDYGASVWLSIPLRTGVSLNTSVARSIPFHLTTARIGIALDLAHLLFPNKHF